MKYSLYITIITLVTVLFSCKTTEEATTSEEVIPPITVAEQVDNTEHQQINLGEDSLFASIERSPCYGTCLTYKMYIYESGIVVLEGIRFIDQIGLHTTKITKEQMQVFTEMAKYIEYDKMEDSYDSNITDVPSATTSIVINGKRKEVYKRADFPKRILKFEQLFDDLLASENWTKIEEE